MGLIHLPQTKWGSGTGRQVILKSDFDKIEQGAAGEFRDLPAAPALEYVDGATLRVQATPDCKARVLLCGFPSPLHPGQWVDAGLSDGRYRENAAPVTLNFPTTGQPLGQRKGLPVVRDLRPGGGERHHLHPQGHAGAAGGVPGRADHQPAQHRQHRQPRLRLRRRRTGRTGKSWCSAAPPGGWPGSSPATTPTTAPAAPSPMAAAP